MLIESLVRRARRRFAINEVLSQGAVALCAALALVVVLLVLGTQILDWQWLVAAPLVALTVGLVRIWRRLPGKYGIARRIDRNLGLSDTLSTAYYYLHTKHGAGSARMRELHRQIAEETARAIALDRAIPFRAPRALYVVAALWLLASGLFAVRYGFSRQLDLRAPLAHVIQDAMGWSSPAQRAAAPKKKIPGAPEAEDAFGLNLPDSERSSGELDAAPENALETIGIPETDPEKYGGKQTKGDRTGQAPGEEGEEASDEAQASSGAEGEDEGQSDGAGKEGNSGKQQPGNKSGENSSLMAKLKEAMQNLLSKMKQQNQSGSQQATASPNGQQQAKNQQGKGGQKSGNQGSQQGQGQEQEGSEDGQAGDDAQMAQNPQGKGSGQSPDDANSQQPGSGIGKQDGNKDTKAAEQLAAMGKISEIIGKRSANVSGEITIEVQSSSQQLRTPYAASNARHGEAAGEVSRDEVPVLFQNFVQQYFEHVRKQNVPTASVEARPPTAAEASPSAASESARRPVPAVRSAGQ